MADNVNTKKRWFAFLVYPDNCSPDWIINLKDAAVDGFISPLHDDENKEHYHVLISYSGPRSVESVQEDVKSWVGCSGSPHIVIIDSDEGKTDECEKTARDPHSYALYLCHKTLKCKKEGKKEFSDLDVINIGTTVYRDFIRENRDQVLDMIFFLDNQKRKISFDQFVVYCARNEVGWFSLLHKSNLGAFINTFLYSHNKHYGIDDVE